MSSRTYTRAKALAAACALVGVATLVVSQRRDRTRETIRQVNAEKAWPEGMADDSNDLSFSQWSAKFQDSYFKKFQGLKAHDEAIKFPLLSREISAFSDRKAHHISDPPHAAYKQAVRAVHRAAKKTRNKHSESRMNVSSGKVGMRELQIAQRLLKQGTRPSMVLMEASGADSDSSYIVDALGALGAVKPMRVVGSQTDQHKHKNDYTESAKKARQKHTAAYRQYKAVEKHAEKQAEKHVAKKEKQLEKQEKQVEKQQEAAGNQEEDAGPADANHNNRAKYTVIIVVCIIIITILFDFGRETLLESVSKNLKEVVLVLFAELTLLGFIGLILFLVQKAQFLKDASKDIFGSEEALPELCETVHMVLFFMMSIFLLKTILTMHAFALTENEWKTWQNDIFDHGSITDLPADGVQALKKEDDYCNCDDSGHALSGPIHCMYGWLSKPARAELFFLFRCAFLCSRMQQAEVRRMNHRTAIDFDFAEYLSMHTGDLTAKLISIPTTAWIYLFGFIVLTFGIYTVTTMEHQVFILLASCGCALVAQRLVRHHLANIREHLLQPFYNTAQHKYDLEKMESATYLEKTTMCCDNRHAHPRLSSVHRDVIDLTGKKQVSKASSLDGLLAEDGELPDDGQNSLPQSAEADSSALSTDADEMPSSPCSLERTNTLKIQKTFHESIYTEYKLADDTLKAQMKELMCAPCHKHLFWCSGMAKWPYKHMNQDGLPYEHNCANLPYRSCKHLRTSIHPEPYSFVLNVLRVSKLFNSMMLAVFCAIYATPLFNRGFCSADPEDSLDLPPWVCILLFISTLTLPITLQTLSSRFILMDFALVTSANTMKRVAIMDKVLNMQQVTKAFDALKLVTHLRIGALAAKMRKDDHQKMHKTSLDSVTGQEKLKLIQKEMEASGDTVWGHEEFKTFLLDHGLQDEPSAATLLATALIEAGDQDGDGKLSVEELSGLILHFEDHEATITAKDIAEYIFEKSNVDRSESIPADQLRDMLSDLAGCEVSAECIMSTLERAGPASDQAFNMQELSVLINRQLATADDVQNTSDEASVEAERLLNKGIRKAQKRSASSINKALDAVKAAKTAELLQVLVRSKSNSSEDLLRMQSLQHEEAQHGLSLRHRKLLREIFDSFDADQGGVLDNDEMWRFLLATGTAATEEDAKDMVRFLDVDGSGQISFSEFIYYADKCELENQANPQSDDKLCAELFKMLDMDNTGVVTVDELHTLTQQLHLDMQADDIYNVIQDFDHDSDGRLSIDEFKLFFDAILSQ